MSLFDYIDKFMDYMGNDQFRNTVITLLGTGWLWLQRSFHIDRKTDRKWDDVCLYIEAGVAKTYQTYVKARKEASADGTLTEEEKKQARQMAFNFARSYAVENGVNLVKEAGAELLPALIEKAVGGLKRDASGPTPIVVQAPPTPNNSPTA